MKMKRRISKRIVGIGILCVLSIGLAVWWQDQFYPERVVWTRGKLLAARRSIDRFRVIEGRNPSSLGEINQYARANPDSPLDDKTFGEYISNEDGNKEEHRSLNGEGGLYYDPETGGVRVNLTRPVKHYLWFYIGQRRNEIPAHW